MNDSSLIARLKFDLDGWYCTGCLSYEFFENMHLRLSLRVLAIDWYQNTKSNLNVRHNHSIIFNCSYFNFKLKSRNLFYVFPDTSI